MPVKVKQQGQYELFETSHKHRILVLDDKQWYAAVEGQQGDILVHSDSDHERSRTLQKGVFYIIDFKDDPKFNDVPHLFLEKGGSYEEVVIPNGLPTRSDHQKRVVWTGNSIKRDELEQYLKEPTPAGSGEAAADDDLPIKGYDELTAAQIAEQLDDLSIEELAQVRRYEQQHKARKTVLEAIDRN